MQCNAWTWEMAQHYKIEVIGLVFKLDEFWAISRNVYLLSLVDNDTWENPYSFGSLFLSRKLTSNQTYHITPPIHIIWSHRNWREREVLKHEEREKFWLDVDENEFLHGYFTDAF